MPHSRPPCESAPAAARRRSQSRTAARAALLTACATALLLPGLPTVADEARDWSRVQLAWRDDPRPPADALQGMEPQAGRRVSRRAQRRATNRRRQAPDDLPPWEADEVEEREWSRPSAGVPRATSAPIVVEPRMVEPRIATETGESAGATVVRGASNAATLTSHRDQPYRTDLPDQRPHGRQRFDIHLPAGCSAGAMPLVVWIHGDTWRDGSKADCPILWLAHEGYAVASIGYRTSDAAVFPAQLEDCRAAIAEIERNAELWGIDPTRVAVAGSGAGGHLAALVGLAGQSASPDRSSPSIAAVFAAAAPTALLTLGPEHERATSAASRLVGGPLPEFREAAQRASPISHVSRDDPPVMLLHGGADTSIPPAQSVQLDAALRAAGVDSAVVMLAGVGHGPSLAQGTAGGVALLSFLDRVLGPGIRADDQARP